MRLTACGRGGLVGLVALAVAGVATAHERTTSYSTWDVRGDTAHVTVRLSELDASHFSWGSQPGPERELRLGEYLAERLQLVAAGRSCAVSDGPRELRAPSGRLAFEWRVDCPAEAPLEVRSAVLFEVAPSHLHFVRLRRDGGPLHERVLSDTERVWSLGEAAASGGGSAESGTGGTTFWGYLRLGVEHILEGYDHLAFLLALLLVGSALRDVVTIVTGFTAAHSITLGLSAFGILQPAAAPVEALIGLSIAMVAAENVWLVGDRGPLVPVVIAATLALLAGVAVAGFGRVPAISLTGLALFTLCYFGMLHRSAHASHLRWAIAFIFGLIHGFGFAAVLGEAGLPPHRAVAALFGFNAGVEVGQLAVVAAVWPLLRWGTTARAGRFRVGIIEGGSAAVLALGVFWFVSRAYG
ncbi:HupE/UreJ family protein [Candidatus Binatia bacterium]|nr:HupE/UreJ family protein [Candidatus Binatia bacterium]